MLVDRALDAACRAGTTHDHDAGRPGSKPAMSKAEPSSTITVFMTSLRPINPSGEYADYVYYSESEQKMNVQRRILNVRTL